MSRRIAALVFFLLVLSVAGSLAYAGSAGCYVKIRNNWTTKVWVTFKCYTETPWETNGCSYENTSPRIDPGESKTWTYPCMPNLMCQKIYISYGRYDRSCEQCTKTLKASFDQNQPKIFAVQPRGTGDFGFVMQPLNGTIIQ